jgi:hypothetical protein
MLLKFSLQELHSKYRHKPRDQLLVPQSPDRRFMVFLRALTAQKEGTI